jgi:DNA-binding CsgD family transcriptional regulator
LSTPINRADEGVLERLPETDPVRALITEILSVVEVSHWSFARFKNRGSGELLLSGSSSDEAAEFKQLQQEFVLQRERTAKGPRLSPTLAALQEPYVSGITLVFADMRREFGVLSLMRAQDLGPFSSVEIRALALALDASIDRLSGFALGMPAEARTLMNDDTPAMLVLDTNLNVVLTWDTADGRNAALTGVQASLAQRLPPIIEKTVHDLVASWTSDPSSREPGTARPVPFITVRTQPLLGPTGVFVGVLLDRSPGGQVFDNAAHTFKLSTRELATLAMLLQGAPMNEIAHSLHITSSTVQDHIKSMLEKTDSRNRSEMIAKLLNPRINPV